MKQLDPDPDPDPDPGSWILDRGSRGSWILIRAPAAPAGPPVTGGPSESRPGFRFGLDASADRRIVLGDPTRTGAKIQVGASRKTG